MPVVGSATEQSGGHSSNATGHIFLKRPNTFHMLVILSLAVSTNMPHVAGSAAALTVKPLDGASPFSTRKRGWLIDIPPAIFTLQTHMGTTIGFGLEV